MPCLSEILGQPQAIDTLRRAMTAGKLAHAYLFTGPSGVGKATCARHLAAALDCEQTPGEGCQAHGVGLSPGGLSPGPSGGEPPRSAERSAHHEAECISCHKIDRGIHPDLLHIEPDGAMIKIGQVRTLEQTLSFAPHEGRYRVVLIDGADLLNLNAANALLKSVEEPRPRTLFVLVASAGHRVPPTLVSRCQRLRFVPLSTELVYEVVSQAVGDGNATARHDRQVAAELAEGSAGRALRLLAGEQMSLIESSVERLLRAASVSDPLSLFEAATEAGRDRQLLQEVLDVIRLRLRDRLLCGEGLAPGRVRDPDGAQEVSRLPRKAVLRQLRAVNEAHAALRGNVNPALTLENLVLNMRQAS